MIISSQFKGTFFVALSGMLFGMMGFFGTRLFELDMSVENMLFWRFVVAIAWISCGIFLRRDNARSLNDIRVTDSITLLKILVFSALSYSGASALYFLASQHIGTGLAMVIFFSFPVFVTLIAWLLGSWQSNIYASVAILAVICGLLLLKGQSQHDVDVSGILLAVMAAICFAAYVYGSKQTTKVIDSRQLTLLVCLGNAVIFFVISCYTHQLMLPSSIEAWIYVSALGIIATALPIQLLLDGLKYISPVKASILSVLEPVVTVLIGVMVLHETLSYLQVIGVMVVLMGAVLSQFERAPQHNKVQA